MTTSQYGSWTFDQEFTALGDGGTWFDQLQSDRWDFSRSAWNEPTPTSLTDGLTLPGTPAVAVQPLPEVGTISAVVAPFGPSDVFGGDLFNAKGGSHGGGGSGGGGHGGGGSGGGGGSDLLTTYTSGDPNIDDAYEFNITINFTGNWTAQEQAIVTWAADLYSEIISADVRDEVDLNGNPVDDIVIDVSTGRIDGSGNPLFGNVLAQTQISAVRDPGSVDQWLPVTASVELDSTDLSNSLKQGWFGTWDDIVLHEMGHALGFAGVVFEGLGLVDANGDFIGLNAMTAYGGTPVPLESGGGAGTTGSHWSETDFAPNGDPMSNELMTGWIAENEQTYLSDTTVYAFADLGYSVDDPSVGSYIAVDAFGLA